MTEPEPTAGQPASPLGPPGIDTTVAHPARMLNYVLGGTAWLRAPAGFTGAVAGKPC